MSKTNKSARNPKLHVCIPVSSKDLCAQIPVKQPVQFEFSLCEDFPNDLLTSMREQVVHKSPSTFSPLAGKLLSFAHGRLTTKPSIKPIGG